jgi:hypothetical protein
MSVDPFAVALTNVLEYSRKRFLWTWVVICLGAAFTGYTLFFAAQQRNINTENTKKLSISTGVLCEAILATPDEDEEEILGKLALSTAYTSNDPTGDITNPLCINIVNRLSNGD